jgi:hypothetical protein
MSVRHFRAHQRFPAALPVRAIVLGREATVIGTMVDLGLGGSACALEQPLRLGENVRLLVGEGPPVELRASVAWVAWGEATAARIGFQFLEADAPRVHALLERLLPQEDVG